LKSRNEYRILRGQIAAAETVASPAPWPWDPRRPRFLLPSYFLHDARAGKDAGPTARFKAL
jgi:hypothetical protein